MSIRPDDPNLDPLIRLARKLGALLENVVFVGGCTTGLLVSDPAAAPVRPTLDIDAIVEIASYAEFIEIENRLSQLGFRRNEGDLICRWFADDLILDLMPTDPSILGFSNRWYRPALEKAQWARHNGIEFRLITAPYFLATKLEAFHGRGKNDFAMSHDLEDIITVIDGRPELIPEISASDTALRRYLKDEFGILLSNSAFRNALPGHLLPDSASQQRIHIVMDRIQGIINLP